ncbi:MAG: hypothetical protein ACTSYJ_07105 [Candidatus Thorarchaeota archaeon]
MVLKIQIKDLFIGFIHNYWTMGIRPKSKETKLTNKVLGYFANLGEILGFYTEYEWKLFDLLWFRTYQDRKDGKPYLHIEHENSPDRLDNLMEKVVTSKAPFVIAMGYPSSKESHSKYVKRIEKLHKKLTKDQEVMFILDPWVYSSYEKDIITAYLARTPRDNLSVYEATRYITSDDIFYATYGRQAQENEE